MRLGNILRSLAMLTLAAISVLAVVAFVALRLGAITPALAQPGTFPAAAVDSPLGSTVAANGEGSGRH